MFRQSQSQSQLHLWNPIISIQRETQILDLFLAAKVREDVWTDDSELHLGVSDTTLLIRICISPQVPYSFDSFYIHPFWHSSFNTAII